MRSLTCCTDASTLKIGLLIALGGLPSSILGAVTSLHIPGAHLRHASRRAAWSPWRSIWRGMRSGAWPAGPSTHRLHEIKGMSYRARARHLGFVVGIFSSLFGLGGGIVLVPTFLYFSELPAHAISATSHFAILLTSPAGLIVHVMQRDVVARDVVPLVAGGLLGGPIGARLSLRLRSPQLLIVVAIALVIAAVTLVWRQL